MADNLVSDIQKQNDKSVELFAKGDLKGLSELYTEDCRFMPPGHEIIIGREGTIKMLETLSGAGIDKMTLTTQEAIPEGSDYATERGVFRFFNKDGKEVDVGKYVVLWRKEEGKWKIYFDIFNADK